MSIQSTPLSRTLAGLCLATLSTCTPAAGVTKGEALSQARKALLAQGWKPRETYGLDGNGERWSQFADAGEMYRAGIIEVESCSGTGLNYCTFNYRRQAKCLSLVTQGEFKAGAYEPTVVRTIARCPDAEAIGTPPAAGRRK